MPPNASAAFLPSLYYANDGVFEGSKTAAQLLPSVASPLSTKSLSLCCRWYRVLQANHDKVVPLCIAANRAMSGSPAVTGQKRPREDQSGDQDLQKLARRPPSCIVSWNIASLRARIERKELT
jgi:hypothetical protein